MMPQFAQMSSASNSIPQNLISKETTEELVAELDSETANKINMECKSIIQEYEQMHNLDVSIYFIRIYLCT